MLNPKVCVVIVTYGNRWLFLSAVLQRVLSFTQIQNVVVVDNASEYNVKQHASDIKVTVLTNSINLGSAGGYKQGIAYAHTQTTCDFIWLLDDDNLPDTTALDILLNKWTEIPGANDKKALFCLREDRAAHIQIAKGSDWHRYYLVPNNFLGFHLLRILTNQYKKLTGQYKIQGSYKDSVVIPYVPYGGLLMHRETVSKIGYPEERLFLYVDDSEYTYRVTQQSGKIWLVPAARVVDIDTSQGINYKKQPLHSQLLDEWSFRTYYHIRNRIYFYSRVAITNKFMFAVNKVIFMAYLYLISLLSGRQKEFEKLAVAVNDGLHGKLGKAGTEKF
ncbi:glycosyltransferase [Mucilaginibacter limnophilus]|uniref:Glycosyltransferase n=1 Tax=Mucilaginibacter limnophilus TaxID=1932778 RepID=A0A437MW15_9SPHI|nr:glycosyltransferase [Mucilaginibacter limnophilus]RVU01862.1 glycosyltransferase [Mucilaginibacter limnophilus]